jgi:GDPmannose 4,6-dehydratase
MYAFYRILLNHESPLAGETFFTRKIKRVVARNALGLQNTKYLGNLDTQMDWGHAKDHLEEMWMVLQQEKAEGFVLANGITTYIRDFVRLTFAEVGLEFDFTGKNEQEI